MMKSDHLISIIMRMMSMVSAFDDHIQDTPVIFSPYMDRNHDYEKDYNERDDEQVDEDQKNDGENDDNEKENFENENFENYGNNDGNDDDDENGDYGDANDEMKITMTMRKKAMRMMMKTDFISAKQHIAEA